MIELFLKALIYVLVTITLGMVGYYIACKCDKRCRDRDLYERQIRAAADKCGKLAEWAVIAEEIQFPGDQMTYRAFNPHPKDWKMGTLADSDYAVIPRNWIALMSNVWQARCYRLLQEFPDMPLVRYAVAARDPKTNLFTKDPYSE
jgi:hypothetical protein